MSAPTARAAASSFDADGPEAFRSGTLNLKMDAISEHVSLVGAETQAHRVNCLFAVGFVHGRESPLRDVLITTQ